MVINATLCYLSNNNKTLMLYRNAKPGDIHKGKFNGVGGKFEKGESPLDCARREIKEETGLEGGWLRLKGIINFPGFDKAGNDWLVHIFVGADFKGQLQPCPEGELMWVPTQDLLSLNLWEGDKLFIPLLAQPGLFFGVFTYQNGKLVSHRLEYGQASGR